MKRGHARTVRTLGGRCQRAEVVGIVKRDLPNKALMIGHRHAIEERGDRIADRRGSRGRFACGLALILARFWEDGDRLRTQVHDIVQTGERDVGMLD